MPARSFDSFFSIICCWCMRPTSWLTSADLAPLVCEAWRSQETPLPRSAHPSIVVCALIGTHRMPSCRIMKYGERCALPRGGNRRHKLCCTGQRRDRVDPQRKRLPRRRQPRRHVRLPPFSKSVSVGAEVFMYGNRQHRSCFSEASPNRKPSTMIEWSNSGQNLALEDRSREERRDERPEHPPRHPRHLRTSGSDFSALATSHWALFHASKSSKLDSLWWEEGDKKRQ